MSSEVMPTPALRVTHTFPGEKKSEEKPVRSICIIWQKVQLDKQQLFWAVCSEEMNHIYGLINCVLHKERGNQRAQAEL